MSYKDFTWYSTFNSFKISQDKAVEVIVLENGLENFLNQYEEMSLD